MVQRETLVPASEVSAEPAPAPPAASRGSAYSAGSYMAHRPMYGGYRRPEYGTRAALRSSERLSQAAAAAAAAAAGPAENVTEVRHAAQLGLCSRQLNRRQTQAQPHTRI